ncbi:MAG: 50S ribosomal protein L30 [Bdellovibrio sp.]
MASSVKKKFDEKKFKVTQMRSTSRATESQVATLIALGLRGRHHSVVLADNPANRGQILKVQHMLNVEVVR